MPRELDVLAVAVRRRGGAGLSAWTPQYSGRQDIGSRLTRVTNLDADRYQRIVQSRNFESAIGPIRRRFPRTAATLAPESCSPASR